MATKKKSKVDDWNSALQSWNKNTATTKSTTTKKKTTSTSDRLREESLGRTTTVPQRTVSLSDRVRSGGDSRVTQTVPTRQEAERKKRRFAVEEPARDPFSQALNRWRSTVVEPQQQRVRYQVPEPQFDYGVDRVGTRPGAFTAQQDVSPTRTTTTAPYDPNTAQGPRERPTVVNAWLPGNFAFARPDAAAVVSNVIRQPELRDSVANLVQRGWQGAVGQQTEQALDPARRVANAYGDIGNQLVQGWRDMTDELGNSAAGEQFRYNVDVNRQDFENRGSWNTVGQALTNAGRAFTNNADLFFSGVNDVWTGERNLGEVIQDNAEKVQLSPYVQPVSELLDMNYYSSKAKQVAMDALAGLQFGGSYLYSNLPLETDKIPFTKPTLMNNQPLSVGVASFSDALGQNFQELYNDPIGSLTGTNKNFDWSTEELVDTWREAMQKYVDAVTPTAEQQATNTAEELGMNRQRAWLNTLGGAESTANTFDALTDRDATVAALYQQANQAWNEGAQSTSDVVRTESMRRAAEAGSDAWQLEHMHPQEIVNQNTNIVRQLISELLLPDPTDFVGAGFELAGLTPKARRLTRVTNEVMTPTEKAVKALDDMVVTAENTAQLAAQRSTYNPRNLLTFKGWYSTGTARAHIATDNMVRYTVNLLSDVETPQDAALLLTTLATDPRRLMTGIPGAAFQSVGLQARAAQDGLVRFGAMNLDRIKEPLRIYQQAAQNVLNSPVLKSGPILNRVDFINEFIEQMNGAGYRYFNVADRAADVPVTAKSGRIVGTGNKSEFIVEYIDAEKKVIGTSAPMTMVEANRLKTDIGKGIAAQRSVIGDWATLQRSIVSPAYILTSPGTWITNILGGMATALGDGDFAFATNKTIDNWITKQFGIDPTVRGLENIAAAGSSASQVGGWGIFKTLKNAYGKIDEYAGKRIFYKSSQEAMRKIGRRVLQDKLTPLLTAAGVDTKTAKRMVTHMYEAALRGEDLTGEFNKLLNGQTKILNLSEVNPTWLDAIPPDKLDQLQQIIRSAPSREEALAALQKWGQETAGYWDELIASSPTPPQRYVWQKQEVAQDAADIAQAGQMAVKYGEVPAEAVQAGVKAMGDGLTEAQRRMQTLAQIVTESADPKNRYVLYNIWGQVNDATAAVRAQLNELAEAANGLTGAQKAKAWQEYWIEAQRLWTERNVKVNKLLEDANNAIAAGTDFTPRLDQWRILERTASTNEEAAMATMRLEAGSGRYDQRLGQIIEAGRQIGDRAVARAYAAARRFLNVDAMDYFVSAEHSVQMAGAQASSYLAKAREAALKSGKWDDFFQVRNEVWRQFRQYERDVWENATYLIVRDGLGNETRTGLRFDAGPDGVVELIRPRELTETITDKAGPRAASMVSGGAETRAQLRAEWDAQVKARAGLPSLDQTIATYTRQGVVRVPEDAFADLYGTTIAGQRISSSTDIDRLLQQYYDMGQQRLQRKAAAPAQRLDLNALRRAANEAGIQTAAAGGKPMDKRLVNTINKDLGIKVRGLRDLTPEQYDQAMQALARRAEAAAGEDASSRAAIAQLDQAREARLTQDAADRAEMEAIRAELARLKQVESDLDQLEAEARAAAKAAEEADDGMRTYEFTLPAIDPTKIGEGLNFGGLWNRIMGKESAKLVDRTTQAGGALAGDLSHGAAFAKQQLENILDYLENNIDDILKPPGRISQGSNLQALDAFRKNVLPAWDNVKYAASEYGNRMRSFTMVDFANQTRLDELLGLYMPYGFWMTRTAKNSLERAIFQPQIWRRVMQTEREIRAMQEQGNYPERYEGAIPFDTGNGNMQWLRLLPSKYWPAAGLFTSNDYADPESANSAFGYAVESMRAANLASYPWFDAGAKIWENLQEGDKWNQDMYWTNYIPQGRIAADLAIKYMGADAADYITPGYFENSVARTLNNMAVKGEITREQARWAHDYLWQLKNSGKPLPEAQTAYNPVEIEAILDKAMRATAGVDLQSALTSWGLGVSVRPYDTTEQQWSGAAANYRNYKYGPENPYGSKTAADTQKPDAQLSWSKSGVWRPEEQRPGVSMATDAKSNEKETINKALMDATDQFIRQFDGTPANWQINDFKNEWMAERTGGDKDAFFVDNMNGYLEEKYPSATTFEPTGGERYPGYAPEEIRQKVRVAAYYQAKEEVEAPVAPVYPGDNATRAQYNEYYRLKDKYDADKKAYEAAIVARVDEIINDPVAIRKLAGLPVTNAPTSISDYLRSNSADTFNLDNALGYPMRPTGQGTSQAGLTPLAGDPATAEAIIEQERTKYMSELEKQVRAANDASGNNGRGGRGYSRRYYPRRGYSRRGYSRRSYGGGGGGGGRIYNVPDVYAKGLSEWLMPDPERVGYQAPNQVRVNVPNIGPDAIKAWRPLSRS